MEASGQTSVRVTVLDGTHKGKTGLFVSKSNHYTKIKLNDDTLIRCKNSFVETVLDHEVPPMNKNDVLLQEMILASLMKEEEEKAKAIEIKKEKAKQHSEMIQKQNAEYETSLKQDLAKQEEKQEATKPVFEEVSPEEMRRVRLLRFG